MATKRKSPTDKYHDAVSFFRKVPGGMSESSARTLATAEQASQAKGWKASWLLDPETDDPDEPYYVELRNRHGKLLNQAGNFAKTTSQDDRRFVNADMAREALGLPNI